MAAIAAKVLTARTAAEAETALEEALASDLPVVIEVASCILDIDSEPTVSGLRSR